MSGAGDDADIEQEPILQETPVANSPILRRRYVPRASASEVCLVRKPKTTSDTLSKKVPGKEFPLTKWGLKFDGKACVREFFVSIEENIDAWNVSHNYVVRRFHELLSGTALKYFRSIRSPALTFDDIKFNFFQTFGTFDFDFITERELRNRKQSATQNISDYLIEIRDLNNKLSFPIPEEKLVDIVKYNLHTRYSPCLSTNRITDLDCLLEICRNFENFYTEPSKAKVFAPVSKPVPSTSQLCAKCDQPGHPYRLCPNIPGLICFKCKLPGVITKSCPNCTQVKHQKNM